MGIWQRRPPTIRNERPPLFLLKKNDLEQSAGNNSSTFRSYIKICWRIAWNNLVWQRDTTNSQINRNGTSVVVPHPERPAMRHAEWEVTCRVGFGQGIQSAATGSTRTTEWTIGNSANRYVCRAGSDYNFNFTVISIHTRYSKRQSAGILTGIVGNGSILLRCSFAIGRNLVLALVATGHSQQQATESECSKKLNVFHNDKRLLSGIGRESREVYPKLFQQCRI